MISGKDINERTSCRAGRPRPYPWPSLSADVRQGTAAPRRPPYNGVYTVLSHFRCKHLIEFKIYAHITGSRLTQIVDPGRWLKCGEIAAEPTRRVGFYAFRTSTYASQTVPQF